MLKTNADLMTFALKLARAEDEEKVEALLKTEGLLDDQYWEYFNRDESNYSSIGNQQSNPVSSLIEKIVNSGDAVLMRLCLQHGLNPEGSEAPKSTKEALNKFLGIEDGDICNLSIDERTRLAEENIILVTTSADKKIRGTYPCICIIDKGEGQNPDRMKDTFLSLSKSNKSRIPFVQGKFSMGGTGVLQFCGKRKFQFILTKRHSSVPDSDGYWGFTLIRKQEPKAGEKKSVYTYLVDENKDILRFVSDSGLYLIPEGTQKPVPYRMPLDCGTFVKLYNYDVKNYSNTNITHVGGLTDGLNMMLAKSAIPVRLVECREVDGRTLRATVAGFEPRLTASGKVEKNIEEDFPQSTRLKIDGDEVNLKIYAFKKDKEDNYKKSESSIVFTLNGQTQGYLSDRFFSRNKVGLEYLRKSLFVIVDCTRLSVANQDELFMNSRDRLRESEFADKVIKQLEESLADNYALKKLKERRRKEALKEKVEDNKVLVSKLSALIKSNPNLGSMLKLGARIAGAGAGGSGVIAKGLEEAKRDDDFIGKYVPTYFNIVNKSKLEVLKRTITKGNNAKIQIETDAQNDYFDRDEKPGRFELYKNNKLVQGYLINLYKGILDLKIIMPKEVKVGSVDVYEFKIYDEISGNVFSGVFKVEVKPKSQEEKEQIKKDKKKKGREGKEDLSFALPTITELFKDDLENQDMNLNSAFKVVNNGNNDFDYFINMDNFYLRAAMSKEPDPVKQDAMKLQYKYGMFLFSLNIIHEFEKSSTMKDKVEDVSIFVAEATKMLSSVFFPIQSLGEINDTAV
jgi:hypothetical protein